VIAEWDIGSRCRSQDNVEFVFTPANLLCVNEINTACRVPQGCEASSQRERFERLAQDFTTDPIDGNVAFIRARFAA
jgi:hypothetical protein